MATLSSTSTDAEVKAAYDDNSGYDIDASVSQCKVFIQACRILLRRLPKSGKRGASEFELTPGELRNEINRAQRFLASNSSGVTHTSFEEFRS